MWLIGVWLNIAWVVFHEAAISAPLETGQPPSILFSCNNHQYQSNFGAVSEQFQSSFRARWIDFFKLVSGWFEAVFRGYFGNNMAPVSGTFSEQFQSSSRAVPEHPRIDSSGQSRTFPIKNRHRYNSRAIDSIHTHIQSSSRAVPEQFPHTHTHTHTHTESNKKKKKKKKRNHLKCFNACRFDFPMTSFAGLWPPLTQQISAEK